MITRVRQVVSAFTARISQADKDFVAAHLNPPEQALFWGMNLPDQRHALNVAYTAGRLAGGNDRIDCRLLTKCALLHDVGKVYGDVSTADKIITVIAHRLAPHWAKRWGRPGRGNKLQNLRHAFYVYFHHPARSAALLQQAGTAAAIADIVAKHHTAPAKDDPPELEILRQADQQH